MNAVQTFTSSPTWIDLAVCYQTLTSSLCNGACAGLHTGEECSNACSVLLRATWGGGGGGDSRAWSNGGMMTPENRTNSENLLLCHFFVHLRSHLKSRGTEPKDMRWGASFQQFQLWHSKFKIKKKNVHNFESASFRQVVSVPARFGKLWVRFSTLGQATLTSIVLVNSSDKYWSKILGIVSEITHDCSFPRRFEFNSQNHSIA